MKKKLLVGLAVGVMMFGMSGVASATTITDDFNDGNDIGWQHITGSQFTVANGTYNFVPLNEWHISILTNSNFSDGSANVQVTHQHWDADSYIVFDYVDSLNYQIFGYANNTLLFISYQNGVGAVKFSEAAGYAGTHQYGVTVLNNTLSLYYDNLLKYSDSFSGNLGQVGLMALSSNFDNFTVSSDQDVSGCFSRQDFPVANRKVILRQNLTQDQTSQTDEQGCYAFASADHSKPFTVTIHGDWKPTSAPTGLQAVASTNTSVQLDWQYAPTDATSFKIFRKKGSAVAWKLINTTGPDDRTYTDTTAIGNDINVYSYYIKGCNTAGCSSPSGAITVAP